MTAKIETCIAELKTLAELTAPGLRRIALEESARYLAEFHVVKEQLPRTCDVLINERKASEG